YGVQLAGAGVTNNLVGGFTPADRNIISGNLAMGAFIQSNASSNRVAANYIGINAAGTGSLGNDNNGIRIDGASGNISGGDDDDDGGLDGIIGARTVISGNTAGGIAIWSGSDNNLVQGNYIGPDATGNASVGSSSSGVDLENAGGHNTIGGASAGSG